eukprot:Phypoly_transcript_00576.p1 GENE.Phypoly_transcript_00576~~Phypoly_transcript_00576.p1  ORF type:complete len:1455 (+),score=279.81 Phypoly_transcript_00576:408-4367(+)
MGYYYALILFGITMFGSVCQFQANYIAARTGNHLRSAVVLDVYRKSLVLSNGARARTSTGNIVNIMSNDAQRMVDTFQIVNNGLVAPFQIIVAIILMYRVIGWPTFVGLGFMILTFPTNGIIAKKMTEVRRHLVTFTDFRVKTTSEILTAIKIIKLYAWEDSFAQRVTEARKTEISGLQKFNTLRSVLITIISSVPVITSILVFSSYVGAGHTLAAASIFTALTYLNQLRLPLAMLPFLLALGAQLLVATNRVTEFLLYPEIEPIVDTSDPAVRAPTLRVLDADFEWDAPPPKTEEKKGGAGAGGGRGGRGGKGGKGKGGRKGKGKAAAPDAEANAVENINPFNLRNVNLDFAGKGLVAVVGSVGSGKSSLCQSLLGEMKRTKGSIVKKGNIAYVPQQAWIINATVRENILFGMPYDEAKYESVIDACALRSDFALFQAGDSTEIGERGINLSGGQKQRVSIARAVYQDSDIYIMDDPLSAVDAHVGKHLFFECIRHHLREKLVILATNQLNFLPNTDRVVFLGDNQIRGQGHFEDLVRECAPFKELMELAGGAEKVAEETKEEKDEKQRLLWNSNKAKGKEKKDVVKSAGDGGLTKTEEKQSGEVSFKIYLEYFKAGTYFMATYVLILFALEAGTAGFTNYWLAYWTQHSGLHSLGFYLGIYIGAGLFSASMSASRAFSSFRFCTNAGEGLHNKLFAGLLRAPMWFFDITPLGRILNRFSRDMDQIDNLLPQSINQYLAFIAQVITTLVIVSAITPIILSIIGPIIIIYYLLQKYYRYTSRELQRIESISRSPIFNHFSETLNGVMSIRAYGCQERMILQNMNQLDNNNKAYLTLQATNQWLGLRLDTLGNLVIFACIVFITLRKDHIAPANVGLSISYALTLTLYLNKATVQMADTETKMNSVERVLEYTSSPQEAPAVTPNDPAGHWPTEGSVKFDNFQMRYREGLDLVLRGINCKIEPGEKIGIVGRTGAGKSSIVLALFRLVEASAGQIDIDNQNISVLGLKTLRKNMAIIPQDPLLFSGTIRSNLDPFTEYYDADLWKLLESIHMKEAVENSGGLNSKVSENGENWSVGQRQIICLGRALLKNPKILVLDEATASVDTQTDAFIQRTIRTEFKSATILTIAHRLNTIMDSSRILVMDKGLIGEFDTPANLLRKPDSLLTWLVDETGPQNAALLKGMAQGLISVTDTTLTGVPESSSSLPPASLSQPSSTPPPPSFPTPTDIPHSSTQAQTNLTGLATDLLAPAFAPSLPKNNPEATIVVDDAHEPAPAEQKVADKVEPRREEQDAHEEAEARRAREQEEESDSVGDVEEINLL